MIISLSNSFPIGNNLAFYTNEIIVIAWYVQIVTISQVLESMKDTNSNWFTARDLKRSDFCFKGASKEADTGFEIPSAVVW